MINRKNKFDSRTGNLMFPFLLAALLLFFLHQPVEAEIYYQWKDVYIGALEADNWTGLVFAPHQESAFAFRLRAKKQEETTEGIDHLFLVSEVGPHSPDGQYSRLKLDLGLPFGKGDSTPILKKPSKKQTTLVMEWSRKSEKTVIGKIFVPDGIEIHLTHYFPWDSGGRFQALSNGHIRGESTSSDKYYYLFWTSSEWTVSEEVPNELLTLRFPESKNNYIYFVASVDQDMRILQNQIYRYKNEAIIDSFL